MYSHTHTHDTLRAVFVVLFLCWLLQVLQLLLRLLLQVLQALLSLLELLLQLLRDLLLLLLQLLLLHAVVQALALLQLPDQLLLCQPLLPGNLLLHVGHIEPPLLLVVVHPGQQLRQLQQ